MVNSIEIGNMESPAPATRPASQPQLAPILAARAIAILVSRKHNAPLYAMRGCEDLDLRYSALKRTLLLSGRTRQPNSELDLEALHARILERTGASAGFHSRLDQAIGRFPSNFGQLAMRVVDDWENLRGPLADELKEKARQGEAWIVSATSGWKPEFRAMIEAELLHVARLLFLFTNVWVLRRCAPLLCNPPVDVRKEVRDFPALDFAAALDDELDEIEKLRGAGSESAKAGHPVTRADRAGLAGLAFSGGGIRSATFNLGILQFLGDNEMLKPFDYLSTVSGGGYIGAWLHAWIHHSDEAAKKEEVKVPGIDYVQDCLSPKNVPDPENDKTAPIRFLRRYSNYLTPQKGLLSADMWTMLTIWVRNSFLNLTILALALSAILLTPDWLADGTCWLNSQGITAYWPALMVIPAILIGINLRAFRPESTQDFVRSMLSDERAILRYILLPILVGSCAAGSVVAFDMARLLKQPDTQRYFAETALKFSATVAMMVLLAGLVGQLHLSLRPASGPQWLRFTAGVACLLLICLLAAVATGFLDYFWLTHVSAELQPLRSNEVRILTLSVPVFLAILSFAVFFYIGLLGRHLPDDRREWISRLGGWLGICGVVWLGISGITAFGPAIVKRVIVLLGSELRGLTAASAFTGAAGIASSVLARKGAFSPSPTFRLAVRLVPAVFVLGLLLLLSYGLENPEIKSWGALPLSAGCLLCAIFLSWRIDINEFSLHQFYRNRLVRCYLGGARSGMRRPNRFTGFDEQDDFRLTALAPSAGHSGPYPILNTTLNVTDGDELAWQERKAESFAFTPRFCGFEVGRGRATHPRTPGIPLSYGGYRPTEDYAYPNKKDTSKVFTNSGIRVGTAMAISGAAVSPNMAGKTDSSIAFLLTLLDVRLGWWLGNPRRTDTWTRSGPAVGLAWLMAELTGSTNDTGHYVYLSDGGHFENLGIYELVRRRCRYVVACDSEEDNAFTFGGLGNAIRKCRSDFGVEIEIDITKLKPAAGQRCAEAHCAIGTIQYPAHAGEPGPKGTLIYIKISLTGDEPADLKQYSLVTEEFPHESTANQWFDETQFESYRTLGFHVARSVFLSLGMSDGRWAGKDRFSKAALEVAKKLAAEASA